MDALGETLVSSESLKDIDIWEFVKEDPEGQALLEENAKRKATVGKVSMPKTAHWASSAFSPCERRDWLDFHGAKPTDIGSNYDVFGMGDDIEARVTVKYASQLLRTQEYIIVKDPRLRMNISGKADLLIEENGEMMVVEVKSIKDFGEDSGFDVWKKWLPKKEHLAQLTLYLRALRLKRGFLVYFNKGRALTARYAVQFHQGFYDAIIEHFVKLEAALLGPEPAIPKGFKGRSYPCIWFSRAPDKKGQPAGMCNFYSHCFAEWPIELAFPNEADQ
mgnify:CR=1 FL=1